ncbi:endonuclease NucS domain-containing protein [Lysinibacillus sp. NPDC097214]|uniref:endonuclease NucS domain-containing protein n=1 Tax=Lysinibacillus sp. NPDC097214 TaxID=3390584 RepID=UPI003D0391ED
MQILSEKEIEDILVLHPELIENGLTLLGRQEQLENRRTDITFKDNMGRLLLVELKKNIVLEEHVDQIEDYIHKLKKSFVGELRGMLIGQVISPSIQLLCIQKNIEWKEIVVEDIYLYLQKNNSDLQNQVFFYEKLHKKAKEVKAMDFQDYLNETSPFGVPYTSYQFFKPIDASPELSNDNEANQLVADQFKDMILKLQFDRTMFDGNVRVIRRPDSEARWCVKTKDGAWQGYILDYLLYIKDDQQPIPCELYLGTIGYRGNKPTFKDGKSRFIVLDIGKGKQKASTQYGFHKHLRTEVKALYPFYELKFNAVGIPKINWEKIFYSLEYFGYFIRDSEDNRSKLLWIGDIELGKEDSDLQVGNLIESLFATTIVKAHYKKEDKGISFDFLSSLFEK